MIAAGSPVSSSIIRMTPLIVASPLSRFPGKSEAILAPRSPVAPMREGMKSVKPSPEVSRTRTGISTWPADSCPKPRAIASMASCMVISERMSAREITRKFMVVRPLC